MARGVSVTSALAITVVCVTISGRSVAAGQEPQQPTPPRESRRLSVKSMSDLRAKTDDEKARALFFDRYGADRLEAGDSRVILPGTPPPPPLPGTPLPTYDEFLRRLSCSAETIALGRAQVRAVHLNQKETFLFTDYDVDVERWLRPDDPHRAPSLKLSTSGGRVTIGGIPTSTGDGQPLDPTKRYILFLKQIPGSAYFTLTRPALPDGDRWETVFHGVSLIPETSAESIRADSLADDIARLGRTCVPDRPR